MDISILENFLGNFSTAVRQRVDVGLLSRDWIIDGNTNRQGWLHAASWGALIQAVPLKFIPLVEPNLDNILKPDLVILDKQQRKVAVIEYEGTNSSDKRLMSKVLRSYEDAIIACKNRVQSGDDPDWNLPGLWLIISTLPDCEVINWPWHAYNNDPCYLPNPNKEARDRNPLAYFEEHVHAECKDVWSRITYELGLSNNENIQLAWANIDQNHLRLMNLNGVPRTNASTYPDFRIFP